jgi:hypothetical protein
MARKLTNPAGYSGPLVGLEIEACASWFITQVDDGEDEASLRSIRRVARYLREMTGLPFRAAMDPEEASPGPTERIPTSSPSNPIWAVRSDYSLDPTCAPNDFYAVGIEVITPPLEPSLADHAGRLLVECMSEDNSFLPGLGAGVHVNVSVPNLGPDDAPGIMLLDPFRAEASNSRLEEFADPIFDTIHESLVAGASASDEVSVLVAELARKSRGQHLTNVLPLLIGKGYVEFRHLGSREFFRNPGRAARLAARSARLFSNLPRRRIASRLQDVIRYTEQMRALGGEPLATVALEVRHIRLAAPELHFEQGEAERHLLVEMIRIVQTDAELRHQFPWAMAFPEWRLERKRRRNSIRSPYAVGCVDRRQLADKPAGLNWGTQARPFGCD